MEHKRKKTSIIWSISKEEMQLLLNTKNTFVDVMRHFGLNPYNGSVKTLYRRIQEEKLDDSHIRNNKIKFTSRKATKVKKNEEVFIEKSTFSRRNLKHRIIQEKLIVYKCRDCENEGLWNNKYISLQLEHINGVNDDNRLENLCFLCPNCHSQTDTYAGKNAKKPNVIRRIDKNICECGREKCVNSNSCRSCNSKKIQHKTKIIWPSPQELQNLLWLKPTVEIAKELGVSDKAVEKFSKKYNLTKPSRGFWKKPR
jgi:Zn finger protein HypA/HybF involved in hydrogenase expression